MRNIKVARLFGAIEDNFIFDKPTLALFHVDGSTEYSGYLKLLNIRPPYFKILITPRFLRIGNRTIINEKKITREGNLITRRTLAINSEANTIYPITKIVSSIISYYKSRKRIIAQLETMFNNLRYECDKRGANLVLWLVRDERIGNLDPRITLAYYLLWYFRYNLKHVFNKVPFDYIVLTHITMNGDKHNYVIWAKDKADRQWSFARTLSVINKVYKTITQKIFEEDITTTKEVKKQLNKEINLKQQEEITQPLDTEQLAEANKNVPIDDLLLNSYKYIADNIEGDKRRLTQKALDILYIDHPEVFKKFRDERILVKVALAYVKTKNIELAINIANAKDFESLIKEVTEEDLIQIYFSVDDVIKKLPPVAADELHDESLIDKITIKKSASLIEFTQRELDSLEAQITTLLNSVFKANELELKNVKIEYIEDENSIDKSMMFKITLTVYDPKLNKTYNTYFHTPAFIKNGFAIISDNLFYFVHVLAQPVIMTPTAGKVRVRALVGSMTFTHSRVYGVSIYIGGVKIPVLLLYCARCKPLAELIQTYFGLKTVPEFKSLKDIIRFLLRKGDEYGIPREQAEFMVTLIKPLINALRKAKINEKDYIYNIETARKAFEAIVPHKNRMQIDTLLRSFLDPKTKALLRRDGYPDNLCDLFLVCSRIAYDHIFIYRLDLLKARIRYSDIVAEYTYKNVVAAIMKYNYMRLVKVDLANFPSYLPVMDDLRNIGLLQLAEEQNPVEQVSNLVKIRVVGPGGIANEMGLTSEYRNLHDSQYGLIDPNDTSESNPGAYLRAANSFMINNSLGLIDRPEDEEEITPLSVAASTIPFVESTDGARVLMACNHVRQAVPLIEPDIPYIFTGYEPYVTQLATEKFVKRSPVNGKVKSILPNFGIVIEDDKGFTHFINLRPEHLKSGSGVTVLAEYHTKLRVGDTVRENQIIATAQTISDSGMLRLGKNMLVAFMDYFGYTYEDAIVVCETVKDKLVTNCGHEDIIKLRQDFTIEKMAPFREGSRIRKGEIYFSIIPGEADILGFTDELAEFESFDTVYIASNDYYPISLHVYLQPGIELDPTRHKPLIEAINNFESSLKNAARLLGLKDYKILNGGKPVVIKAGDKRFTYKHDSDFDILIKMRFKTTIPLEVGDKLTNRFGNKGVVSLIESKDRMPKAKNPVTGEYETIDIILSRLGIISRMNSSQFKELLLGNIIYDLNLKVKQLYKENKHDEARKLIAQVYETLDNTKDKSYSKYIKGKIYGLSDKQLEKITLRFMSPPLNGPKPRQILEAAKLVGTTEEREVYIPALDTTVKAAVGRMFIYKLEHMAEIKTVSRAAGPYNPITFEALRGRKRDGGQRISELETWGYIAYDAVDVLKDLVFVSGDDIEIKNQVVADIIEKGEAHLSDDLLPTSKKVLAAYFASIGLEVDGISDINTLKKIIQSEELS